MFERLITRLSILFAIIVYMAMTSIVKANDIYITQSGDNLDLDITQDGQNNQVEGLSGSGNAIVYGANSTATFTQTGNNNQIRVWSDSSSGKKTDVSQTGNNISLADNTGK